MTVCEIIIVYKEGVLDFTERAESSIEDNRYVDSLSVTTSIFGFMGVGFKFQFTVARRPVELFFRSYNYPKKVWCSLKRVPCANRSF
jgi:hypothetical protein